MIKSIHIHHPTERITIRTRSASRERKSSNGACPGVGHDIPVITDHTFSSPSPDIPATQTPENRGRAESESQIHEPSVGIEGDHENDREVTETPRGSNSEERPDTAMSCPEIRADCVSPWSRTSEDEEIYGFWDTLV